MKNWIGALALLACLQSCGGEPDAPSQGEGTDTVASAPKGPDGAKDSSQPQGLPSLNNESVSLVCGDEIYETEPPTVEVRLMAEGHDKPLAGWKVYNCEHLEDAASRDSYEVPEEADWALLSFYAGAGDLYYGKAVGEGYEVYTKSIEEGHPDVEVPEFSWEPFRSLSIENGQVKVVEHEAQH